MIVGFTAGAFDLLHAGHVFMLSDCKKHCDKLIVGLHTDPTLDRMNKNKPVQSVYERQIQLTSCKYVDSIIPYSTEKDLENMMATLSIHKRFVGEEYINTIITGQENCLIRGIEIVYNKRMHSYSSSELRERTAHEFRRQIF